MAQVHLSDCLPQHVWLPKHNFLVNFWYHCLVSNQICDFNSLLRLNDPGDIGVVSFNVVTGVVYFVTMACVAVDPKILLAMRVPVVLNPLLNNPQTIKTLTSLL
jgi:hypothetical protein